MTTHRDDDAVYSNDALFPLLDELRHRFIPATAVLLLQIGHAFASSGQAPADARLCGGVDECDDTRVISLREVPQMPPLRPPAAPDHGDTHATRQASIVTALRGVHLLSFSCHHAGGMHHAAQRSTTIRNPTRRNGMRLAPTRRGPRLTRTRMDDASFRLLVQTRVPIFFSL